MSESSDILLIKLEGRNWLYRLRHIEDEEATAIPIAGLLERVDVVLVRGMERVLNLLKNSILENHSGYSATIYSAADPLLVIGPERLVGRFVRGLAAMSAQARPEEPGVSDVAHGIYPDLPNLSDIPPLALEGVVDPFGANEKLLGASWSEAAAAAGSLAARLHKAGAAMAVPEPVMGTLDAWTQPWSAAISLRDEPVEVGRILHRRSGDADWTDLQTVTVQAMNMVQRCVTSACASGIVGENVLNDLATAVEHMGYCVVASSTPVSAEATDFEYYLGELIAHLHSTQSIHGDIHRENFSYNRDEHKTIVLDSGSVCFLRRPLTATEKARDIAVFKLQCSAEHWEAFKLGYSLSELGSEFAEDVFALI